MSDPGRTKTPAHAPGSTSDARSANIPDVGGLAQRTLRSWFVGEDSPVLARGFRFAYTVAVVMPLASLLLMGGSVSAASCAVQCSPAVVATIARSPLPFGRITGPRLHRAEQQVIAQDRLSDPSAPPLTHRQAQDSALTELLEMADIEGEARELRVFISGKRVSQRLSRIKETRFRSDAAYREYLRSAKLTSSEVRERVRWQLLMSTFEYRATQGIQGELAKLRALLTFYRDFAKRWRERTVCAAAVAIKRCSNWTDSRSANGVDHGPPEAY
jgi:hypothetical protein